MNARLKENKVVEIPELIVGEVNAYSIIFQVESEKSQ
jgi:hypothetical protein